MNADLFLLLGLALALLAVPGLLGGLVDRRVARLPLLMGFVGCLMVAVALQMYGGSFRFSQLPDVVFRAIGRLIP